MKAVDKSMSIFLVVFFGISGAVITIMAWLQPMPVSERILVTFVGSVGLLVELVWGLMIRLPAKTDAK